MDFNSLDNTDPDDSDQELDGIGHLVRNANEDGCGCGSCEMIREITPYLAAIRMLRSKILPDLIPANGSDAVRKGLLFVNALLLEAAGMIDPMLQIKNKQCIDEVNPKRLMEMLESAKMSMVVHCDPETRDQLAEGGKVVAVHAHQNADGTVSLKPAEASPDTEVDLRDVGNGMNATSIFKQFFKGSGPNLN